MIEDAVCKSDQLGKLIRDEDDSDALRGQFPNLLIDLLFRAGVDAASRIVQHQHPQIPAAAIGQARPSADCRPTGFASERSASPSGCRTAAPHRGAALLLKIDSPYPVWRVFVGARQGQIHRQTETRHDSLDQPLRRHIAKPLAHQSANVRSLRRAASERDRAGPSRPHAGDRLCRARSCPSPDRPPIPSTSPRAHLKRYVGEFSAWTAREPDTSQRPSHTSRCSSCDSSLRRGRGRP